MQGTIRKREKSWAYAVELGKDFVTNKRRRKTNAGFRTKKECEAAMKKLINELTLALSLNPLR